MHITHPFAPIYNSESKILILGTIPSVKSREVSFYYGHPQNRFWHLLSMVFNEPIEDNEEAKISFLLNHKIALFDVLKSCDITSSSDSSIKNPIPNDFTDIINNSHIDTIFTTGKKAYDLYNKYCYPKTNIKAILLPSPSPANCKFSIEELSTYYKIIKEKINN